MDATNETVGDRLKKARKAAGMTQKQLADAVLTKQGAISDLENGRNSSSTKLVQMATILGVNPSWLSTGSGAMKGRGINDWSKCIDPTGIPVYILSDMQELIEGREPEPFNWEPCHESANNDGCFWIQIQDDSMSPEFNPNDRVMFSPAFLAKPGSYVIARIIDTDVSVIRRWRPIGHDVKTGEKYSLLEPVNPYHAIIDSRFTPFSIYAVALTHKRQLRNF